MKAINQRRSIIDQAVQSTFGIFGQWNSLRVLLYGGTFALEEDYLRKKGVPAANIERLPAGDLTAALGASEADILFVHCSAADIQHTYAKYLALLNQLRDTTKKKRVLLVESDVPGYGGAPVSFDGTRTIKSIYLDILAKLEKALGKDYVLLHEKLINKVAEEDYQKRLSFLFECAEVKALLAKDGLDADFQAAQVQAVVRTHAAKCFESGFIAGQESELRKLQQLLKPKQKWEDFVAAFPKDKLPSLRWLKISPGQTDIELPLLRADMWNELEVFAGEFFDYHCGKAFNRLSSQEKVSLTGEDRFEEEARPEPAEVAAPSLSFRKFEVPVSPLNSLMGPTSSLLGGIGLGIGKAPAPAPALQSTKYSLTEYKEVVLALLASWHRQCVYVGGSLFEYTYETEGGRVILGSAIAINQDPQLLHHVNNFAATFGLPQVGKSIDTKAALKSFFAFNQAYLTFFDKVRSQLKLSVDFTLGSLVAADYEAEKAAGADAGPKVQVDVKARREKERKKSLEIERGYLARLERIKSLKESRVNKDDAAVPVVLEEETESTEGKGPMLEKVIVNSEELEMKRLELEEKIEAERRRRAELEEAIRREQELRDLKRRDLEEERIKQKEVEKAERLKRQQRLIEERKKRDEVKNMRAKNLRDAFEKAREAALKKQQGKSTPMTKQEEQEAAERKINEKKKYNSAAVKMMIRFGNEDKKIMSKTGIEPEDLKMLRAEVELEDQQLTS